MSNSKSNFPNAQQPAVKPGETGKLVGNIEQLRAMPNIINLRKKWKGICSQVPFIVLKYRQGCI